jgi:hypothetical protein
MASRNRKAHTARTPSADAAPPPAPSKRPRRGKSRRSPSKKRPTGIPPNWFTRKDVYPMEGELSLKFPTDYVVCMRGLARLHGRSVLDTFKATLWSYLKLTRGEQLRAMDLDPAMPAQEIAAWGGVHPDGRLLPWASRDRDRVHEVVEDDNRIVRVVIRHLPSEPGIKPRGWKE